MVVTRLRLRHNVAYLLLPSFLQAIRHGVRCAVSAAITFVVHRAADLDIFVRPGLGWLELIESAPRRSRTPDRAAPAPARAHIKVFLHEETLIVVRMWVRRAAGAEHTTI